MDCRVTVEAAVSVYDVETVDEAVSIAISKTGEMLNPDLSYVDISKVDNDGREPGFVAADEGLVGLELEMTVYEVEDREHASRVASKEIGQQLVDIPLTVKSIDILEDEDADEEDVAEPEAEVEIEADGGDAAEIETGGDDLPDFDDIMD